MPVHALRKLEPRHAVVCAACAAICAQCAAQCQEQASDPIH
jgi:hypothetical protein